MPNHSIVTHPFTFKLGRSESGYLLGIGRSNTFSNGTHPLQDIDKKISAMMPLMGDNMDARVLPCAIVNRMYYDTYNNGTGNAGRWSVTKEYKKALRNAGFGRDVIRSLEQRLSEVFSYMKRGRNFGCVQEHYEFNHKEALEMLATDLVYFTAQILFPEDLKALEASNPNPYKNKSTN